MSALRHGFARLSRALDHPAILPGLLLAGSFFVVWQVMAAGSGHPFAVYDAHSYWLAGGSDHPYAATIASGFDDSVNPYKYRYPPPLAQLFVVLHLVPWPLVAGLWTALTFVAFLAMAGKWAPLLLLFPPVLAELWLGNVNLLIGLAIVIGLRWPAAWAFVLLTKMTPGIGLLWFAVRGEWRSLGIALAATAIVTAVSFVLAPSWWFEFRDAMTVQASGALDVPPLAIQVSLPIRLVIGALVVVYGARTDRAWLVPVAATIAAPALWWNVFVILVASVALAEGRGLDRPLVRLAPRRATGPARA
jgi:Glycosyltransferase family 87